MKINGKVVDIEFEIDVPKNGGGSYVGTTLTYKDSQGKVQTKSWVQTALNHAANAHIKTALQTLVKGTNFQAEAEKNDKGFWNWTDLKIVAANESVSKPSEKADNYASSKVNSTWQTAEERAQTQIYIIRQNAITNAVNLLKDSYDGDVETIFNTAKEFEKHVLGIRENTENKVKELKQTLADLEDDLV